MPPACVTTCFTIASPRPVPRDARARSDTVEALEQTRELRLLDADAVVGTSDRDRVADAGHRQRERRPGACVADRVLGEVLGDDAEHARPDLELDVGVALEAELDTGTGGPLCEFLDSVLEHGCDGRGSECDDTRARFELGEKEHLVDELGDLVDLATSLLDERRHVLAGECGRLEEGEEAGKRGSKLVGHRSREARPQLLVRRKVAFAREVHESLASSADLIRDDERNDAAPAGQQVRRKRLALVHAVDRLPRAAAREHDPVLVVEDDDRLPALLDERAASDGFRVGHVTAF